MRSLRHLYRNASGATAIEFAIIAPVMFVMMLGIIELSLLFFTQHTLENASFNMSRLGKTGFVEAGMTREQTIRKMLEDRTMGLMTAADIEVTSKAYQNYTGIGQPEPFVDANGNDDYDVGENFTDMNGNAVWDEDRGLAGPGDAAEVVLYTISYPWTMITPALQYVFGGSDGFTLSTSFVVRNEPYDDEGL